MTTISPPAEQEAESANAQSKDPAITAPSSTKTTVKPITDEDEEKFQMQMRAELEKVIAFSRLKSDELRRRIDDVEHEVEGILAIPPDSEAERKRKAYEALKEVSSSPTFYPLLMSPESWNSPFTFKRWTRSRTRSIK